MGASAVWAELPLVHDAGAVAYVIDPGTGELVDVASGWEAAQCYVLHEGMVAVAIASDGAYWTVERQQELYDVERARFVDCWG